MSRELKMGDCVRITSRSRVEGYQPGDKGVVLEGPAVYAGASDTSYVVAMDKGGPAAPPPSSPPRTSNRTYDCGARAWAACDQDRPTPRSPLPATGGTHAPLRPHP